MLLVERFSPLERLFSVSTVCILSFGRSYLVPFSSCVLCSFFIHTQIFDLLHYYLFVKNDEKTTHSGSDTDTQAEKILTAH